MIRYLLIREDGSITEVGDITNIHAEEMKAGILDVVTFMGSNYHRLNDNMDWEKIEND